MSFDYIRDTYNVPAKRGMRVMVVGRPGKITSTYGTYLKVRFDGEKHSTLWHPTWRVVYLATCPDCKTLRPLDLLPYGIVSIVRHVLDGELRLCEGSERMVKL